MIIPQFELNPFELRLSFHKVIERLEQAAAENTGLEGEKARALLERAMPFPEIKNGFTTVEQIERNEVLIADLLADLFPAQLTLNEIKAVTIPYQAYLFNMSQRFKNIMNDAGPNFQSNIRDFGDHQFYVFSCCLILNRFYGTKLDFTKPLFYDIPTAAGIIRHYRIIYNADFIDLIPTEKAVPLTEDDIAKLVDNYDDLDLWKEKFPPSSYILKGFAIVTLFDATVENAVSNLKSNLLQTAHTPELQQSFEVILQSIFNIPDVRMGFTAFDQENMQFTSTPAGKKFQSFLLSDNDEDNASKLLCKTSYHSLIVNKDYFTVSDVPEYIVNNPDNGLGRHFQAQNVNSFILAPVVKNDVLLGILELVSPRTKEFNSVNANKLGVVMPLLIDAIERKINENQNRIRAVIQNNYTTLHPSVDWKFRREAQNYIQSSNEDPAYVLKQIKFKDVYPLYGQVDIKDSSITRNLSVQNDLKNQLEELILIFEELHARQPQKKHQQNLFDLNAFLSDLSVNVYADTEQQVQGYLETNVYPILKSDVNLSDALKQHITAYFDKIDTLTGEFYSNRRKYETTLSLVNTKLASILDKRQEEIQRYYPHYFERFKTDGVEHNLYIGASIAPNQPFNIHDLHRLRLWQMRVITEMENGLYHTRDQLPYRLGVTSLVLVFAAPLAIRFRMDEKHFDIDGAYNIRYEVVKKRIDKAHIHNTSERITKQGKITIVYSRAEDETEYRKYIRLLQNTGLLANDIEQFEVEELQGVSGLKALRVGVLYNKAMCNDANAYEDIYKQLDTVEEKDF